jgi:tetratricopeptide (TPR) repeat protein
MATALGNGAEHQEAIAYFLRASELGYPLDASFHLNMGNSYAELKQHQLALENYKEAVRLDSSKIKAWKSMALTHHGLGQKKEALAAVEHVRKMDVNGESRGWVEEAEEAIHSLGSGR